MKKKTRIFEQGQRVAVCTKRGNFQAVVANHIIVENDDDLVHAHVFYNEEDDDSSGIESIATKAHNVYEYAFEKTCPKCGNLLCFEHNDDIDYPYFCPECDENLHKIEINEKQKSDEFMDDFIQVGELRKMLEHLDDDDFITVNQTRSGLPGYHKILCVEDSTSIGFWEIRI